MPLVFAEIPGCGRQAVIVHVIDLPGGVRMAGRQHNRFRAVDNKRQWQQIAPSQVEKYRTNLQANPAGEGPAARAVDHAWTQDDEFKTILPLILPKQLLLPQLGMRVRV